MLELVLTLAMGGTVMLFGGGLIWWNIHTWRRQQRDPALAAGDLAHYAAQYRRRLQASSMIALLGLLLCFSTAQVPWQRAPITFTIYVLVLFGLVFWAVLLVLGDYLANRLHHQAALARLYAKQKELEQSVARLRSKDSNGHRPTEEPPSGEH